MSRESTYFRCDYALPACLILTGTMGVYVVAFDQIAAVKIGYTRSTDKRISQLEACAVSAGKGRPLILIVGATTKTELSLHKALSKFKYGKRGEWYKASEGFFRTLLVLVTGEIMAHLSMPSMYLPATKESRDKTEGDF